MLLGSCLLLELHVWVQDTMTATQYNINDFHFMSPTKSLWCKVSISALYSFPIQVPHVASSIVSKLPDI